MPSEPTAASTDPLNDVEEFVRRALDGEAWECRDNYPYPEGVAVSWVERGVGDKCERFIETPLPYEEAVRIEQLLQEAQDMHGTLRAINEGIGPVGK